MSEVNEQFNDEEFTKAVGPKLTAALQDILKEHKDDMLDVALCIVWKPELHKRQIPKCIIETSRTMEAGNLDPVAQTMSISTNFHMSAMHVSGQLINYLAMQANLAAKQLKAQEAKATAAAQEAKE